MAKVFLILIDGMRPDSLAACGHPFYRELLSTSRCSLRTRTVMPSVTLPCHMSLFHSVGPDRHGTVTNIYVPQVRPINGLCEVLDGAGKNCAFFYDWEPLRDLARPLSIARADFISGRKAGYPEADRILTERIEAMLKSGNTPDFTFFYICWADEAGHKYGWMSPEYIESVRQGLDCAARVASLLDPEVKLILTADHGGHDRCHGTEMPEDMTIPLFIRGKGITPGELSGESSILDIAPPSRNSWASPRIPTGKAGPWSCVEDPRKRTPRGRAVPEGALLFPLSGRGGHGRADPRLGRPGRRHGAPRTVPQRRRVHGAQLRLSHLEGAHRGTRETLSGTFPRRTLPRQDLLSHPQHGGDSSCVTRLQQ